TIDHMTSLQPRKVSPETSQSTRYARTDRAQIPAASSRSALARPSRSHTPSPRFSQLRPLPPLGSTHLPDHPQTAPSSPSLTPPKAGRPFQSWGASLAKKNSAPSIIIPATTSFPPPRCHNRSAPNAAL